MKRILFGLGVFALTLAAHAQELPSDLPSPSPQVSAEPTLLLSPVLTLAPTKVVQGQSVELNFQVSQPGKFKVEVAGQSVLLYENGQRESDSKYKYRAFLAIKGDLKPGGYTLRIKNEMSQVLVQEKLEVLPGSFYTQYIRFVRPPLTPEQAALVAEEDKAVDEARLSRTGQALWDSPFMLPVPHRMSAAYGTRRFLNGKYNGYHSGVDFASPHGYPVKAPANAIVALARYFSKYNSNGNTLFLDHGQGVTSVYIHLSKLAVKAGERVKKGQTIGYIGTTGRSTGPHLHWGLYLNGQNTDGMSWIRFSERAFR